MDSVRIHDDLEVAGGLGSVGPEELDALVLPDVRVQPPASDEERRLGADLEEDVQVANSAEEADARRVLAGRLAAEAAERVELEVLLRVAPPRGAREERNGEDGRRHLAPGGDRPRRAATRAATSTARTSGRRAGSSPRPTWKKMPSSAGSGP